jgi:hypothetical protein
MIDCYMWRLSVRKNLFMRQLEFFTRLELAAMRDRTRSRHYSAEGAAFRHTHERHRRWGLARRHAQKLCRSHGCSDRCGAVGLHDSTERVPPLLWDAETTAARPLRPEPDRRPDAPPVPDRPAPSPDLPSPDRDLPSPDRNLPQPSPNPPPPGRDLPSPGRDLPSPGRDLPSPGRGLPQPSWDPPPLAAGQRFGAAELTATMHQPEETTPPRPSRPSGATASIEPAHQANATNRAEPPPLRPRNRTASSAPPTARTRHPCAHTTGPPAQRHQPPGPPPPLRPHHRPTSTAPPTTRNHHPLHPPSAPHHRTARLKPLVRRGLALRRKQTGRERTDTARAKGRPADGGRRAGP